MCRSRTPRSSVTNDVRVARNREPGVGLDQIAKDFGIHVTTLYAWMKKADIEDGERPGTNQVASAELREAKRRIRLLEQHRYTSGQRTDRRVGRDECALVTLHTARLIEDARGNVPGPDPEPNEGIPKHES